MEFEVMDSPSQYHAILERPAFSCFMAVPHYTYLVLKIPGPSGIITVKGSFELSDICDKEFHKMVQYFGAAAEYGESKGRAVNNTTLSETLIDDTPEAKKLWVHTEDPNKFVKNKWGTPTA
jgi:hypothetical protein